jgi:hypothetical protein
MWGEVAFSQRRGVVSREPPSPNFPRIPETSLTVLNSTRSDARPDAGGGVQSGKEGEGVDLNPPTHLRENPEYGGGWHGGRYQRDPCQTNDPGQSHRRETCEEGQSGRSRRGGITVTPLRLLVTGGTPPTIEHEWGDLV